MGKFFVKTICSFIFIAEVFSLAAEAQEDVSSRLIISENDEFEKTAVFKNKSMFKSTSDLMIPTHIWHEIEKFYVDDGIDGGDSKKVEKEGTSDFTDKAMREESVSGVQLEEYKVTAEKMQIPLKFMKVDVYLKEKDRGVLKGNNFKLNYGPGGGYLDLAEFMGPIDGVFSWKVKPLVPLEEVTKFRVLFWPNGKRRKIDGRIYGSDCDKLLELTSFFAGAWSEEGFAVSTKNKKSITILAGVYIFLFEYQDQVNLAQITIKDSRYNILQCRPI